VIENDLGFRGTFACSVAVDEEEIAVQGQESDRGMSKGVMRGEETSEPGL
jgi:translation initiation factor 1 (eIF-1/SUI1)